jgi:hypothetical protein
MDDLIASLKKRARILHRSALAGDPDAIDRLTAGGKAATPAGPVRRRHCLAAVAREIGFSGWQHLRAVLAGTADDFGTTLSPPGSAAYWNIWFATHDEARAVLQEHDGYLLAWRRHFFLVDRHYVEMLGLDPDDTDWDRIDRDWARPTDLAARNRLYAALITKRLEATGGPSPS